MELVAIPLVFLTATITEGGDWMPGSRMIVPHLAPLAIVADAPIRALFSRPPSAPRVALARPLFVVALFSMLAWQLARTVELGIGITGRPPIDAARIAMIESLERDGARSVALLDLGLVAWHAPSMRFVDLGGLTDRTIARSPGLHGAKLADLEYLESLAPDRVVLTSNAPHRIEGGRSRVDARFAAEQHVERSDWLAERYDYVTTFEGAPHYRMHVFARR